MTIANLVVQAVAERERVAEEERVELVRDTATLLLIGA